MTSDNQGGTVPDTDKCPNCGGVPGWAERHQGYCFDCWNTGVPDFQNEILSLRDKAEQLERRCREQQSLIDWFLNHCDKNGGECHECSVMICPHKCPLHFHHDGCPMCLLTDAAGENSGTNEPRST